MRCSECSTPVKPIVAVDIDGTLGDYHGHFLAFARQYLGPPYTRSDYELAPYEGAERFRDYFCATFASDLRTFRDIKLAYRQGAQKRSMPAYPGVEKFIMAMFQADAEVWLTTTRPYLRLDGIDPDTRAWLTRYGVRYDALLYDEDKYTVLSQRVDPDRVVAVLDDQEDQLTAANSAFPRYRPAIMRNTLYNRAVAFDPYVINLHDDARTLITGRLRNWRSSHAHARAA